ncbi:MAG TPA: hypothetical protein VNK43_10130 [Gemmatimonadales bacterium]|nr:hypothetical protein [Gemmatimonadales bacterium]
MSRRRPVALALAGALGALALAPLPGLALAQDTVPLPVGAPAPDFALTGATRYGVLREPIRLADFRDKTVVIAFFFRARTKG